jgi:hypothetical protein
MNVKLHCFAEIGFNLVEIALKIRGLQERPPPNRFGARNFPRLSSLTDLMPADIIAS